MRSPALWLYLLGAVTILIIVLRRVVQRQAPLNDEIYAKQILIEHVHSGVAWVRADGTIGSANPALAKIMGAIPRELMGTAWTTLFPIKDRPRMEEIYRQSLLMGKASLDVETQRLDGTRGHVDVAVVSVHDHKTRFVGHYCLMEDRTQVLDLEEQIRKLTAELAEKLTVHGAD